MLNNALNWAELAGEFKRRGRVVISDAFATGAVQELLRSVESEVRWSLAYREGGQSLRMDPEIYSAMQDMQRQSLVAQSHQEATQGFQFLYQSYMLIRAYLEDPNMPVALKAFVDFMNAASTRAALGDLIGRQDVAKIDGQATRYSPGHFLSAHDDRSDEHARLAAYVLNLSPAWRPDWGGLLHMLNSDNEVVQTIVPKSNQMTVFRVPQGHFVSMVAPYAGAPRYSITGWLRAS